MAATKAILASLLLTILFPVATPAFAERSLSARSRAAYRALRAGDGVRALSESALAVRENPTQAGNWAVRGYILSHQGDKPAAEQAYREAIRLDPGDPVARNNLGSVLLDLARPMDALRAFQAALALHPFYADARNNLGAAFERLGRDTEASRAYRVATVVDPRHARAHNNLGAIQLKKGDVRSAAASFARAASLDPAFGAPALNLALLDEGSGDGAAVLARLEAAASAPGASPAIKARAYAMRAGIEADGQRWPEARRLYLLALQFSPTDTTLLNNVAVVEDQLGMDREALLHLTEALDLAPQLKVAQNNIGIVHVHRGKLELAEGVFRDLLQQDANFHRAHYNLGVIHASRGELKQARSAFARAARLAPRDAASRYNLAILSRQERGGLGAEMRAYEQVLRLDEKMAEAHLALGTLLADPATPASLRDAARARRHLDRFLVLAPAGDAEGRAQAEDWLGYLDSR